MAANSKSYHGSFSDLHELSRAVSHKIDELSFDGSHVMDLDNGLNTTFKAQKVTLENQLREIEREITDLEHEIESQQATEIVDEEELQILRKILRRRKEDGDYFGDYGADVTEMSKQVDILSDVTGIKITNCKCKLVNYESRQTERKYIIDGDSQGLGFQLEFGVTERQIAKTLTNSYISNLKVAVDEAVVDELETLIYRCEKDSSVNLFLRTFSNFCYWINQRKKCFAHFKKKYPKLVEIPHGEFGAFLQFSSTDDLSGRWMITWNLLISTIGNVTPEMNLFVKAPAEMIDMDDDLVLQRAPERFSAMVQHLGVEQAIDTMIRISST